MERKQLYIVVGVVVFFALLLTFVFLKKPVGTGNNASGMDLLKNGANNAPVEYTTTVPSNAVKSVPVASSIAAPGATAEFGIFNLTIDRNGFHPASLAVKRGDIVQIKVTSLDGTYDMWIPRKAMYWKIPKGETKPFTFTAAEIGTFLFECRDFCPSGKILQGTLITK
jgi:plastocyanin